tara:strand:+ start:1101 stop:2045 length:945 start_codon:yes stop_codon:yes gene_type:complete
MFLTKDKNLIVFLYSLILIISSETLLLRLSPNLFPILCSIPLIFAGQIISSKIFFSSIIITNIGFFLFYVNDINFFDLKFTLRFFLNYLTNSSLVFLLFRLLNLRKKNSINNEKVIIFFNLFVLSLLLIFNFFYYFQIDHQELRDFISQFFSKIIQNSNIQENIISEEGINFLIKIIPSLNAFVLMTFIIINFFLTNIILKKINFTRNYTIEFSKFFLPQKVFLIFNILIFFSILLTNDMKFYFFSTIIVLSFLFFYQGLVYSYQFLDSLDLNIFLKILIIFLLFIFLGYVLFLLIFLSGYYISLKRIITKVSE